MIFMNIIKKLQKNKIPKMNNALNSLFVDIYSQNDCDNGADDFDFDGTKSKPFHKCFFMHNQEYQHEDYSNKYDEDLDLFIPNGDEK